MSLEKVQNLSEGTKVLIKKGLHTLEVGSVGILKGVEGVTCEGTAYNVEAFNTKTQKISTHILVTKEFEVLK